VSADLGNGTYRVEVILGYSKDIVFAVGEPPVCSCATCVNRRLPCKYFVAVCNLRLIDPKQECYLQPQWHLRRHPLFRDALRNLSLLPADHGLSAPEEHAPVNDPSGAMATMPAPVTYGQTFSVPREHYDRIQFPKDMFRRHNDLNTLANEVVTLGKHNEQQFKLAMAALAATKVKLMSGRTETAQAAEETHERPMLLPPATKVQRRSESADQETMKVSTLCLVHAASNCL
jgi:hypothetical protein